MKRQILLFIFTLGLFGLHAQQAPQTQKSLITKVSATWCPPCGTWGWEMFDNLKAANPTNAILVNAHHSGDLDTPTSVAFASNLGFTGQPQFFLDNTNVGANFSNADAKVDDITAMVNAAAQNMPVVNVGLSATHDDTQITVATSTEFFQAASGEYRLALYVVDNGYVGFQASNSNMALHEKVLVSSFTDDHFGTVVGSGSIDAGTIVEGIWTIDIANNWEVEKLEIAAILWKADNGDYTFENGNVTDEINLATNVSTVALDHLTATLQPTILTNQSVLTLDLTKATQTLDIQIFHTNGQLAHTFRQSGVAAGIHQTVIDRSHLPSTGLYLVRITTDEGQLIKRMIVKQ